MKEYLQEKDEGISSRKSLKKKKTNNKKLICK